MSLISFDQLQRIVTAFSPAAGSPASPLETTQFLRSVQPSLMPRTSIHQGAMSGLAILSARAASNRVDYLADKITPNQDSLSQRLIARGLLAGVGLGMRKLPDENDTAWPAAFSRLTGELIEAGAIGGFLYEAITATRHRSSASRKGAIANMAVSAASLSFALYRSRENLKARRDFFTEDFDKLQLTLPKSIAVATVMTGVGTSIGFAHQGTRRAFEQFFGPGIIHTGLARTTNNVFWAGAVTGLYWAGISKIGKSNEKIDPGYAQPPSTPLVSGSADSLCSFEDLGQQGRRYVSDVLPPSLIEATMAEPAKHPIRIFVGFNEQPLYPSGRSEIALAEMERTGAYERGTLLLISPTGTGWVDHSMIESAEFFTRGDLASVCIQFGRYPSFLSLQKVRAGRQQFRQLVWGVHQRLQGMDPADRPRVLVFGESLGAWASSDVVMKRGIEGLDHYSIDRALWFGMPQLARWSAAGMDRPGQLTPDGTVGVFDRWEELELLSVEERQALRIVQLSHDNDPITLATPTLLYRKPAWLGEERGRGVPEGQRWSPVVTFLQTAIDAANAMRDTPGEFRSTGHDYRADTARFVAEGYQLPYTEEQLAAVEVQLRSLEIDRAARMKPAAETEGGHTPSPAKATEEHHKGVHLPHLRGTRTAGARWLQALRKHTPPTTQDLVEAEKGPEDSAETPEGAKAN